MKFIFCKILYLSSSFLKFFTLCLSLPTLFQLNSVYFIVKKFPDDKSIKKSLATCQWWQTVQYACGTAVQHCRVACRLSSKQFMRTLLEIFRKKTSGNALSNCTLSKLKIKFAARISLESKMYSSSLIVILSFIYKSFSTCYKKIYKLHKFKSIKSIQSPPSASEGLLHSPFTARCH